MKAPCKEVAIQSPATRAFLRCCAPDRGVASPEYFFKGLMQDTTFLLQDQI